MADLWNTMIRDSYWTFTTSEKSMQDVAVMIGARQGAAFVAEQNGRFAGFVTFGQFRAGPGYSATVEHSIMVAENVQGTGVGRSLLLHAEDAARALGHHVMVAGISGANPRALAFHDRLGYAEVGRMPQVGRKWDEWLDLVLMQKIL